MTLNVPVMPLFNNKQSLFYERHLINDETDMRTKLCYNG